MKNKNIFLTINMIRKSFGYKILELRSIDQHVQYYIMKKLELAEKETELSSFYGYEITDVIIKNRDVVTKEALEIELRDALEARAEFMHLRFNMTGHSLKVYKTKS